MKKNRSGALHAPDKIQKHKRSFFSFSTAVFSAILFTISLTIAKNLAVPAFASADDGAYVGLEFYGSPQISRAEVERMLGLHNGASYKSVLGAIERLKRQLKARRLEANIQAVTGDGTDIYLSVDILGDEDELPSRILENPQQVNFRSEEPLQLLEKLHQRLEFLEAQGRPANEEMRDGVKYYCDEPCNQIVKELLRHCQPMREELLYLIDHDPNAVRRTCAVELLSWAGEVPDTALRLLPAVDDIDLNVRTMVTRYLFKCLPLLPDDFPFQDMVEVYSRDLSRPSHDDRSKSLYMLLALVNKRPELIRQVKSLDAKRTEQLREHSLVPSIKLACGQFQRLFARANVGLTDVKPNLDFLPP
ncbi:MAG: hypothetical protein IT342_07015 [Candidatus Melainabacteria bacterium]|nr:hypothetical protein [Candidatus Melainabacteria bacterium]